MRKPISNKFRRYDNIHALRTHCNNYLSRINCIFIGIQEPNQTIENRSKIHHRKLLQKPSQSNSHEIHFDYVRMYIENTKNVGQYT